MVGGGADRRARSSFLKAPAGAGGRRAGSAAWPAGRRRAADPAGVRRGDGARIRGPSAGRQRGRPAAFEAQGRGGGGGADQPLPGEHARAQRQADQARPPRPRMAPIPVAIQPRQPGGAPGLPAPSRGFELSPRGGPAPVPQGARRPRLREPPAGAGGDWLRDALRGRRRPRLRFRLGPRRAEPAGGRRGMRRGDRRLRRRRGGYRRDPRRGRAGGRGAGSRPVHGSAHLPRRTARRARRAIPRWGPDDRRGPARDPDARSAGPWAARR